MLEGLGGEIVQRAALTHIIDGDLRMIGNNALDQGRQRPHQKHDAVGPNTVDLMEREGHVVVERPGFVCSEAPRGGGIYEPRAMGNSTPAA